MLGFPPTPSLEAVPTDLGVWQQCVPRVLLLWLVPFLTLVGGGGMQGGSDSSVMAVIVALSMLATLTEVVLSFFCRRAGKGKVGRNPLSLQLFLLMFAVVCFAQISCFWALGPEAAPEEEGGPLPSDDGNLDEAPVAAAMAAAAAAAAVAGGVETAGPPVDPSAFQLDAGSDDLRWSPSTMSVILPCAEEREYAMKTVRAVFESTPAEVLKEIVVVDDGSQPPLSETHLGPAVQQQYKVKLLRHEETVGLIGAKKTGGDAAEGDVLAFFDCHVAPQAGWYKSFLSNIGENYRRMVVPQITALDVNTWTQVGRGGGMAKCYLTWDADFKWFDSDDVYIAVISGGLLGMSRRWWAETGGYDKEMLGWGGENLDQSLRVWLCGGEIVVASDSEVAHMWRTSDPKTRARYHHVGDTGRNRARAVYAWYGDFATKLRHYPTFASRLQGSAGSMPWYGDLSNFDEVKHRLAGCRPFAWFLRRFKHLYEDAGLVPDEVFMLREETTGQCLHYDRSPGTSSNGHGEASLQPCDPLVNNFYWHRGNRDLSHKGRCCSGLRAWNTDQCLEGSNSHGQAITFVCDVSGRKHGQDWKLSGEQLSRSGECLGASSDGKVKKSLCISLRGSSRWKKVSAMVPLETQLYRKAQREHPTLFGALGVQPSAVVRLPVPTTCKAADGDEKGSPCRAVLLGDRCFDEMGLLTTARAYCAPYMLTHIGAEGGQLKSLQAVDSGHCLDSDGEVSPEHWLLRDCDSARQEQHFELQGDALCILDGRHGGQGACFQLSADAIRQGEGD